jgi:hypothetical protein
VQAPLNFSREKVEADAARVDALRAAGSDGLASKVPDGNHGDNLQTTDVRYHLDVALEELHWALARAQADGASQEFMSRLSLVINNLADLQGQVQ